MENNNNKLVSQYGILFKMKSNIDRIKNSRILTGEEHPKHKELFDEINFLYDFLTLSNQEDFDSYVN